LSVEDLALRHELSFLAGDSHFLESGFELHRLETAVSFEALGDRNNNTANGSSIRDPVALLGQAAHRAGREIDHLGFFGGR
jgi:hypothetical protein